MGLECKCFITENCTDGNLIVFKDDIKNVFCTPKIENEIAIIDFTICGNSSGNFDVIADCEEGQSTKKTILVLYEAASTTSTSTITLTTTPTTIETCVQDGGYCGRGKPQCCPGLECCEDYVCKKMCRQESRLNMWVIAIGALSVLIVIGVLFLVGNIL
jgi:hypothetical protein